jgi:hypothetical protein
MTTATSPAEPTWKGDDHCCATLGKPGLPDALETDVDALRPFGHRFIEGPDADEQIPRVHAEIHNAGRRRERHRRYNLRHRFVRERDAIADEGGQDDQADGHHGDLHGFDSATQPATFFSAIFAGR